MEAHNYSDDTCPTPTKRMKMTSDYSLLHLFVHYVAAQEQVSHTDEEIRECVEVLKRKTTSKTTPFQSVVRRKLNLLLPILLACNDDVNFVGSRDQTILHIFVMYYTDKATSMQANLSEDTKIVEVLLKKGASANVVDLIGNTPVHYAAFNRRADLVQLMLASFTNVNAANNCGYTVLYWLVHDYRDKPNDLEIANIRTLISKGANYRTSEDKRKMSPLDVAIKYGLIKVLLAFQMDQVDSAGLLFYVSRHANFWPNYPEELQHLDRLVDLRKSVHLRIDESHVTPLHYVSKFGRKDAVEIFVNAGANIDAASIDGVTPLHLAVMKGQWTVVKFLIERGANLHARDSVFDFGLMHLATCKGNKRIINLLIDKGLDVNDRSSKNGLQPLHLAAMKGVESTITCLIGHGADVNCRTREKQLTPLHLIVSNGFQILEEVSNRMFSLIIREFLDGNNANLQSKRIECICLMIQSGAQVNGRDFELKTPLYRASESQLLAIELPRILRILLKHGARVDVEDVNKKSPIANLQLIFSTDELKQLVRHGADINDINDIRPEMDLLDNKYEPIQQLRLIQAIGLPIADRHKRGIQMRDQQFNNLRLPMLNQYMGQGTIFEDLNAHLNGNIERQKRFIENMNLEIAKMKSHYLSNGETSLYDFLHMNSKHRLTFAESVLSLDLEIEYPLYHVVIENSCRRAINEKSIITLAASTLKQLIELELPVVCTEKIFSFMSLPEMTAFIDIVESFSL